jgi:hypothetical protein
MKAAVFFLSYLVALSAQASQQRCKDGALITSQTFNIYAVSLDEIQKSLEANAQDFCNSETSNLKPAQITKTRTVNRSDAPFLLQDEACFACQQN